ncbi:MAG: hypothetical protein II921_04220, partial [Treponema sp.]|nr:hypothetical protein [Treponema sp.]
MKKRFVFAMLISSLFLFPGFSQEKPELSPPKNYSIVEKIDGSKTFVQRLQWDEYDSIRFYKIEIEERNAQGEYVQILERDLEENFIELSLPSGSYRYRVSLYNALGNFENQSDWLAFTILKALQPKLTAVTRDDKTDNLVFSGENLLPSSKFEMTYTSATGKKIVTEGKIAKSGSGNKSQAVLFSLKDIPAGKYTFSVSNPGGLTDTREFEIKAKPVVAAENTAPAGTTVAGDKNPSSSKDTKQSTVAKADSKQKSGTTASSGKNKSSSKTSTKKTDSKPKAKSDSKTSASKSKATSKNKATSKTKDSQKEKTAAASEEAKPERKGIAAAIDNIQASIGYLVPIPLIRDGWEDYIGTDVRFLNFGLRASTIPFKTGIGNLGFGVNASYSRVKFEKSYNVKSFTLTGNIFNVMLEGIWTKPLTSKFTLDVHAGAGIALYHNFIYDYDAGYSSDKMDSISPIVGVGAAVQFTPVKHFYVEGGADVVVEIDKNLPGLE